MHRLDKLGLVIAGMVSAALFALPFATFRANRIVAGEGRTLLDALAPLNLAYVSLLHGEPESELIATLAQKARANGVTKVLMNDGFPTVTSKEDAQREIELDYVDAAVVGRQLIANPDLVRRWQEWLPVTAPDESTFYTGGEKGYTDYPVYTAETHD